jgi:hypothetical protein
MTWTSGTLTILSKPSILLARRASGVAPAGTIRGRSWHPGAVALVCFYSILRSLYAA